MVLSQEQIAFISPQKKLSVIEVQAAFLYKFGKAVSSSTVRKYQGSVNRKPAKTGGARPYISDEEYLVLHKKHRGDYDAMAKETGMSAQTLEARSYKIGSGLSGEKISKCKLGSYGLEGAL